MIYEAEPEQEEEMEAEDNTMEGDNDCPPEDESEEEDTPAEDEPQQAPCTYQNARSGLHGHPTGGNRAAAHPGRF